MITRLQSVYDYSLHNFIVPSTSESQLTWSHCCSQFMITAFIISLLLQQSNLSLQVRIVTSQSDHGLPAISTNHPSRLLAVCNECVRATCIVLLNSPLCHLSPSARGVLSLLMMGDVKSDGLLLKGGWGCNPPQPAPSSLISASGDWWQVPPSPWTGRL